MDTAEKTKGSAEIQGGLWSARARDWAEIQEGQCSALFAAGLAAVGASAGRAVLDVGCGAGGACLEASRRGASVSGIDAAPALVEIARSRLSGGRFTVGEMEELPYEDRSFDAVTGFNSFQYAARPLAALAQARRVARAGAPLLVAAWGPAARCEAAAYIGALGSLLPPPPPGAPGPFALSEPGALERLVADAGLRATARAEVECVWSYPDLEIALRGLLSAGPAVRAIQAAGEPRVREAVARAIATYRSADGSYRLENVFAYVVAEG